MSNLSPNYVMFGRSPPRSSAPHNGPGGSYPDWPLVFPSREVKRCLVREGLSSVGLVFADGTLAESAVGPTRLRASHRSDCGAQSVRPRQNSHYRPRSFRHCTRDCS
eukprot:7651187-Pyramimonas_sp.AAC.2